MKQSILIYTGISLLFMLASCTKDFIDVAPESNLTEENFYKTESDFQQALTGAYQSVRTAITGQSGWIMGEMRSDNTHYEQAIAGTSVEAAIDIANFTDGSSNVHSNEKYFQLYAGISRTNIILSRIQVAGLSQQATDDIVGQTKFLRALFYLELVQYYGGVPLYQSEITSTDQAYLPRASREEVVAFILSDVQDAIAKLPNPSFPQSGRATKGAAKMALAYLYMIGKDYPGAERELKDITAMGYSLVAEYADTFDPALKNGTESIFEAQYQAGNQGQQSDFIYYFLPVCVNLLPITGVSAGNAAFSGLSGGWNFPTPAMISEYEPNDQRLDASIGIVEGTGPLGSFAAERLVSVVGYTPPPGKTGKPFVKKYLHAHTTAFNTDDNWPIYRYADALLLLAEALNEQNKNEEALTYLNQVRSRTGLAATSSINQSELRDIIAHERKMELAFENHRWLDLVRTGKAVEVMIEFGIYIKTLYPNLLPGTYNVTDNRLIFPIPAREIQIGSLTQNPGY